MGGEGGLQLRVGQSDPGEYYLLQLCYVTPCIPLIHSFQSQTFSHYGVNLTQVYIILTLVAFGTTPPVFSFVMFCTSNGQLKSQRNCPELGAYVLRSFKSCSFDSPPSVPFGVHLNEGSWLCR